jgi:hypothetical protein
MTVSSGNKIAIPLIAIGIIMLMGKFMTMIISIAHNISGVMK